MCDGEPMGVCWGETVSNDDFEGHYLFFKRFWGKAAMEAVVVCMGLVKSEHSVTNFIGIIPVKNRRSIAFAKRLGFKGDETINLERYGDCLRLTKEIE